MDPMQLYLAIINVLAFLAIIIDYLCCKRWPWLEDKAAHALILTVFPVAGGALGMLLSLILLTGFGRGRRMSKDNVAWWFLAIACLVAWGLVGVAWFGVVTLDASVEGMTSGWDSTSLAILGAYLAGANVATFAAFAWDKRVATRGNDYTRRIPEARLLALSILGGAPGGLLAMHAMRHKTRKWYFVWGLPAFVLLDTATVLYAHLCGLI